MHPQMKHRKMKNFTILFFAFSAIVLWTGGKFWKRILSQAFYVPEYESETKIPRDYFLIMPNHCIFCLLSFFFFETDSYYKCESPEAKGCVPKAICLLLRVPAHRRGKATASKVDDRKIVLILLLIGSVESHPGPNHRKAVSLDSS